MSKVTHVQAVKVLPWGEEVYLEIPLHSKKSTNKFYARHGKTSEGMEYVEFSKFGPKPNTDGETYSQKLRLFEPRQWAQLRHYVEGELSQAAGWDLKAGQKEFEDSLRENKEKTEAEPANG